MQVRNLMQQPVVSVGPGQSVRQAARLMQDHVIGSVVVQEGDRLAGILTERDVLRAVAEGRDLERTPVAELMTKSLVTAGPNWDVVVAASVMTANRIRHLVVQEQDRLLGVLSLRDVLSVFLPDQVHEQ
ncbi:MAG TPA: CBS domain-containing protein [Actinomycetes bacterium]|jgi:CBS domain-containing protein|nr:CBS domain-containing protein [Actinomycetes bacterium]